MPPRIPKPCRATGCRNVTTDKSGYCDGHADQRSNWKRYQRGRSDTQRGYGWAWRKLRAQILRRDNHLCQECYRHGRVTAATTVDHITPKAHGGTDDQANLQSLCKACHAAKTAIEHRGGGGQIPTT